MDVQKSFYNQRNAEIARRKSQGWKIGRIAKHFEISHARVAQVLAMIARRQPGDDRFAKIRAEFCAVDISKFTLKNHADE